MESVGGGVAIRAHESDLWLFLTGTHWAFEQAVAKRFAKDTLLGIYCEMSELVDSADRERSCIDKRFNLN
jgi:hypothetical protein